jgi:uncharacterized protein YecE (DUF72 family)
MGRFLVGCAGWSLPRKHQALFEARGSHLASYASRFPAVEINSSFYRPHRRTTWARWGAAVPPAFRFSVKVPRTITHERRLVDVAALLDVFLAEVGALEERLGCLLVQLPPSLAWDPGTAESFFRELRSRFAGIVAVEPRHPTWFDAEADSTLRSIQIARVAADPAVVPAAAVPGGWPGQRYYRMHGSPRTYWSAYEPPALDALAGRIRQHGKEGTPVWCIFDNTAADAAIPDALALLERLQPA